MKSDKTLPIYALAATITYYIGYRLYALDREIIYTWINVIHYITAQQITLIILASTLIAYHLSKKKIKDRHHIPILLTIAALATLPYLGKTQPEADFISHYDAARHIQTRGLRGLTSLGEIGYGKSPLVPLIHAIAYTVFGEGYLQAEMIQKIFYILLPALAYLIGKNMWDSQVGFHAGLLTLATPSILQQNYLMMQDIPVTFFTLLTAILALKARKDKRYLAPVFLSAILCVLSKINGLIFVFAALTPNLASEIIHSKQKKKALFYSACTVLVLAVLISTTFLLFESFRQQFIFRAMKSIEHYQRRLLSLNNAIPITSVFYQIGFAQVLLAAASIALLAIHRDKRALNLLFWIIIPVILLWGRRIRYLMPVMPAVSILAAAGINRLGDRKAKALVYSATSIMLMITLFVTPQIVGDYVFSNIMYAGKYSNTWDIESVGVYLDFLQPWRTETPLVSAADYYSNMEVTYLGGKDAVPRTGAGRKYKMPDMYVDANRTRDELNAILKEDYVLVAEWSGGIYYYHDPYIVKYYVKKPGRKGPTDSIIYASNIRRPEDIIHDFWHKMTGKSFDQQYSFGPLKLASYYGWSPEDWLGEGQILVKPPDDGSLKYVREVKVPKDSYLSFSISLRPDTWHPLKGDGVRFRVSAKAGESERVFLDRYIDPKNNPQDRRLFHYSYRLDEFEGKETEFIFQTFSGPNNSSIYDTAGYGNPVIAVSR